MYYQGHYKPKASPGSGRIMRSLPKQLAAVLVIMLLLLLLKYTKNETGIFLNEKARMFFYSDYTEPTTEVFNKVSPYIQKTLSGDLTEGQQGNEDSESAQDAETTEAVNTEESSEAAETKMSFIINEYPLVGQITSKFGERINPITKKDEIHTGIDIDAKKGTAVKAVKDGTVEECIKDKNLGLMIAIDHGNGYKTRYAHLMDMEVIKGDTVKAGDIIGHSGDSGQVTAPHLHFEITKDGEAQNPEEFLTSSSN
jgi:murein DD-endopeptidase MepM/ murein hydrolase activator NlpD